MSSNRAIRYLLAALLSIATAVPPATRHAHANGAEPHRHGEHRAGTHHDHQRHSHAHHGEHEHADNCAAPTAHLHLALFLFDLTLPVPSSDGDPRDEDRWFDGEATRIVRVLDQELAPESGSPASAVDFWAAALRPLDVFSDPFGVEAVSETVTSLPLCDSARRARSGVQLI